VNVASKIHYIELEEISDKMLTHPIKRYPIEEAVVRDERDHSFVSNPVGRIPKGFYIWIAELCIECCGAIRNIGLRDSLIDNGILPILIIIILIHLPSIIRRIPNDDKDWRLLLPFDTLAVFG